MFLLQVAAPQGIRPGAFNPAVIHEKVVGELAKVKQIGEQIGNTSLAIGKLPDKTQRKQLEVQAGSVFNISGKASELVEISKQLRHALKAASKELDKNTKAVFGAKADILQAIGELEVDIASGKYSVDAAFARSKRADKVIRATLQIAESGGLEDKKVALENIQSLKEFQNVPTVALALAKNAPRIAKLETATQNPALLPFLTAASLGGKQAGSGPAGGGLPPDLAAALGGKGKKALAA